MCDIEVIEISKKEYKQLIEDQKLLRALEGDGVDNWEGYDQAREFMGEDE